MALVCLNLYLLCTNGAEPLVLIMTMSVQVEDMINTLEIDVMALVRGVLS